MEMVEKLAVQSKSVVNVVENHCFAFPKVVGQALVGEVGTFMFSAQVFEGFTYKIY